MKTIDEKLKCSFDKPDGCHALACYSKKECNSRNDRGHPRYIPTEIIKKEMGERYDKRI